MNYREACLQRFVFSIPDGADAEAAFFYLYKLALLLAVTSHLIESHVIESQLIDNLLIVLPSIKFTRGESLSRGVMGLIARAFHNVVF